MLADARRQSRARAVEGGGDDCNILTHFIWPRMWNPYRSELAPLEVLNDLRRRRPLENQGLWERFFGFFEP